MIGAEVPTSWCGCYVRIRSIYIYRCVCVCVCVCAPTLQDVMNIHRQASDLYATSHTYITYDSTSHKHNDAKQVASSLTGQHARATRDMPRRQISDEVFNE